MTQETISKYNQSHYKICENCGNRIYNNAEKLHICDFNEERGD